MIDVCFRFEYKWPCKLEKRLQAGYILKTRGDIMGKDKSVKKETKKKPAKTKKEKRQEKRNK